MVEQSRAGERRKHFRSRSRPGRRIELRYRRAGSEDDEITAVTANIGVGGAFVLTIRPEAVGTQLVLAVQIPDRDLPLRLRGEVRWTKSEPAEQAGMGVKFAPLEVEDLLALSGYFATLRAE
jgi:type IV pilus assembly protein PilZ